MSRKKTNYPVGGTRSVYDDTDWYLVVRVLYKLALLGIRWYGVSIGMPVYIEKKWIFGRVIPIPDWLTQQNIGLLSLSKFKLSRAISRVGIASAILSGHCLWLLSNKFKLLRCDVSINSTQVVRAGQRNHRGVNCLKLKAFHFVEQISWKVKLLMCFEHQILNVVIFNIFKSVETVRPAGLNEYCLHEERPGPLWASI